MATFNRRPLANRSLQNPTVATNRTASSKRPRSPDTILDSSALRPCSKRVKSTAPTSSTVSTLVSALATRPTTKDRKHAERAEREQQKVEFKEKFTRAFPTFTFCFDIDNVGPVDSLVSMICQLGGKVDDFFSNSITHFITNRLVPHSAVAHADKENNPNIIHTSVLKSPIKLKTRLDDADNEPGFDVLTKAISYNKKIWNTAKLESVLTRLLDSSSTSASAVCRNNPTPCSAATINSQRVLTKLLQSERVHGTLERDPSQKRHDFRYFSRSCQFVLVEDMRQELATISAHEYPVAKGRDGSLKPSWPVLYCHPHTRGPFIAYDEKEKRRWEKTQQADADQKEEGAERRSKMEAMKRHADGNLPLKKTGDLRRAVSMKNLRRRATFPAIHPHKDHPHEDSLIDLDRDGEFRDSTNPSGFLASGVAGGYMAASGNSVGITSTTGTTSNAGYAIRDVKWPNGRMKQEFVTSRKFPLAAAGKEQKVASMGPPSLVPSRQPLLRKSRSTNTLKLPKREEGSKPGYCESCRVKFDDFNYHIMGRRHRKFASNDANFLQLDCVLARVQRRTRQEIRDQQNKREERRRSYYGRAHGEVIPCPDDLRFSTLSNQIWRKAKADDTEMIDGSAARS